MKQKTSGRDSAIEKIIIRFFASTKYFALFCEEIKSPVKITTNYNGLIFEFCVEKHWQYADKSLCVVGSMAAGDGVFRKLTATCLIFRASLFTLISSRGKIRLRGEKKRNEKRKENPESRVSIARAIYSKVTFPVE